MGILLLDKTRKINKLLQNSTTGKVVFNDICSILSETLESNVLVISRKGKLLGFAKTQGVAVIKELVGSKVGTFADKDFNERILGILSTKEHVNLETLGFAADCADKYKALVTPIDIAGERLGTLFVYRVNYVFDIDDIILSEYGASIVGLEILRSVNEEEAEEDRRIKVVRSAIGTLSYSEREAIIHVFDELGGNEGTLITSRIADNVGITRSVIVNALRKLESAGVIEAKSSGMKGTYIHILNDAVRSELGL